MPEKVLDQKKFGSKKCGVQKLIPKGLGPKMFVKIGTLIAEILLILTNVTSTKVVWTTVPLTDILYCQE